MQKSAPYVPHVATTGFAKLGSAIIPILLVLQAIFFPVF